MLVNVNPPDWDEVHEAVERIIREILATGAVQTRFDGNAMKLSQAHRRFLAQDRGPIIQGLKKMFSRSHKRVDRKRASDAFNRDTLLRGRPRGFVPSRCTAVACSQQATDWLNDTYEKVLAGRGFPQLDQLQPPALNNLAGVVINRKWLLEQVRERNQALYCCPYCGDRFDWNACDLDHFLPKEDHPTLSVNFWNLVPVCKSCNNPYKLRRDPLPDGQPDRLRFVALPYEGKALGDFMRLRFSWSPVFGYQVRVTAAPGTDQATHWQIKNFVRSVDLENHWTQFLPGFHSSAKKKLIHRMQKKGIRERDATRVELLDMAEEEACVVSHGDYALLKWQFWRWLANDPTEYKRIWNDVQP